MQILLNIFKCTKFPCTDRFSYDIWWHSSKLVFMFLSKVWSENLRKFRRITELLKRPKIITLLTFVLTVTVTDTTQKQIKVNFATSKSKCTYFVSYSSVLSLLLSWPVTDFPSLIKMATRNANPNNGVFWMGNKTLKVPMTLFAQNRRRLVEALKKDTGLLPNSVVLLQGGQYTFHHWGADYLLTKFWT